jgi:hypothetical protein
MQHPARVQEFAPLSHPSVAIKVRAPPWLHGLTTAVTVYTDMNSTISCYYSSMVITNGTTTCFKYDKGSNIK